MKTFTIHSGWHPFPKCRIPFLLSMAMLPGIPLSEKLGHYSDICKGRVNSSEGRSMQTTVRTDNTSSDACVHTHTGTHTPLMTAPMLLLAPSPSLCMGSSRQITKLGYSCHLFCVLYTQRMWRHILSLAWTMLCSQHRYICKSVP